MERKAKSKGSKRLILEFFLANVGRVIQGEELRQVSGNVSEWARRVRELRDEEGYQILTHRDRANLKPGEYLLETVKRVPAFSRSISKETRAYVLERNGDKAFVIFRSFFLCYNNLHTNRTRWK